MRTLQRLFFLGAITLASACSPAYHAQTSPDDVYYSTGDPSPTPPPAVSHSTPANSDYSRSSNSQQYSDNSGYSGQNQSGSNSGSSYSEQYRDSGGNNITNNYYNGDYDDYGYTSRLRRFYAPMPGYGYYDPYYCDPFYYGPSFGLSIGFGYGFGLGFGYNPFYNPFWPYYGFGLGYYGGYYGGFYSPFYAGYYNPYFYGYDGVTNYHYGPRGSLSGNGRTVLPPPRGGIVADPVVNNRGVQSLPESVRGVNNPTSIPVNGVVNSVPLKTTGTTGIISQKNANGGTRLPVNSTSTVAPLKGGEVSPVPAPTQRNGNLSTANQADMSHGGTIRPSITPQNPVHQGGQIASPNSRSQAKIQNTPNNSGGTVRPNYQQPVRSRNQYSQPGNQSRNINPQRSWNNNNARSNRSYDSPRQYHESQPRMQPRMEQRQFSTPSHNYSTPSHNSGGGGNGGGGGGGGSRGSSHSGGGGGRR